MGAWPEVLDPGVRAVVLVEGPSDRAALERLAARRGRDLDAEDVTVRAIGGATNIRRWLTGLAADRPDVLLAGLCDVAEERYFRRALEVAGHGVGLTRSGMARLGFHVCVDDLEDELIRALGADAVEAVVASQGELGRFRTLEHQPAQRGWDRPALLHRFIGTRAGRKIQYAPLLVDALDLDRVPEALDGVLAHVGA